MIQLQTTTSRLLVKNTPFAHKDLLKSIAGASWCTERRCWTYPLSPSIMKAVLSLYPSAELDAGAKTLRESVDRTQQAISLKSLHADSLPDIEHTALKPWSHQKTSFHFARHLLGLNATPLGGGCILALDMGCGKTKATFDLINNHPHISTVLVTCPKTVIPTWSKEAVKHHSNRDLRVLELGGKKTRTGKPKNWSVKDRTRTAKQFLQANPATPDICRILAINHESVWREPFRTFVKERIWDLLVVDECHRAKAAGGRFSRFLGSTVGHYACRMGLTGTPMPKDPMDIYAQARFIDPGVFGTSFVRFKSKYGVWGGFENRKLIGLKNEAEFNEKLDGLMYRVKAEDVLDLPPTQFLTRSCVLDADEWTAYSSMKEGLIVSLRSGVVTAANALVKLLRLQQIAQGTVTDDEGNVHRIGASKQSLLRELLEDLAPEEPVVVFARFSDDLHRVRETCESLERPRRCYRLHHGIDELADWQDDTSGSVIAVQYQAGGVGVDLSRARYTIFYSGTFVMGDYEQAIKRTHRPGQERPTFYYHLLSEGTIDADIMEANQNKKDVVESVLGSMT